MTNNKVTAIYSDEIVGMLTDPSAFASCEARNLKGRNIESSTNPLSGQSQSNSVEVSGLACSTCKVGNIYFKLIPLVTYKII